MPIPVSSTVNRSCPSSTLVRTWISPFGVNFNAFEIRFETIRSHASWSTRTGDGGGGQSTISRRPDRSTVERNMAAISAVRRVTSVS